MSARGSFTDAEVEAMRSRRSDGEPVHVPVLGEAVLAHLRDAVQASGRSWIVDATVGLGGHASLVLDALPEASVLGLDQDPEALDVARRNLSRFGARARLRRGRLSQLGDRVREEGVEPVAGILFDLGASSLQLDRPDRGFSFQQDGPLDMRMDPSRDRTAADIVNSWDESDLADLFYYEGGETRSRAVAHAIVESRRRAPFLRTAGLASAVTAALGASAHAGRIHPATKVFQALRRAVNEEGEELLAGLSAAAPLIAPGGRLVALSFHSGEDREVKRFLLESSREGSFRLLTRKPAEAGQEERRANPRSRSAKLRAAERLAAHETPGGER